MTRDKLRRSRTGATNQGQGQLTCLRDTSLRQEAARLTGRTNYCYNRLCKGYSFIIKSLFVLYLWWPRTFTQILIYDKNFSVADLGFPLGEGVNLDAQGGVSPHDPLRSANSFDKQIYFLETKFDQLASARENSREGITQKQNEELV